MRRLDMESDLRHAIEDDELEVVYQPIVQAATGRIVGFEALCRWPGADGSSIEPAEFVPIAEETGLIVAARPPRARDRLPRARRVARAARRRGADDRRQRLAPAARRSRASRASSRAVLERTGLDPRALRLEVREHDLAREPEADAAHARPRARDARRALADRRLRHGRLVAAPAAPLPGRRGEDLRPAGERHGPRRRLVRDRQGDRRAGAQPRARGDRRGRRDRRAARAPARPGLRVRPGLPRVRRRWRRRTRAPCSRRARWSASATARRGAEPGVVGRLLAAVPSRSKRAVALLLVADLAALLELAVRAVPASRRGSRRRAYPRCRSWSAGVGGRAREACRARARRSARDRRRRARVMVARSWCSSASARCFSACFWAIRASRSACSASRSRVSATWRCSAGGGVAALPELTLALLHFSLGGACAAAARAGRCRMSATTTIAMINPVDTDVLPHLRVAPEPSRSRGAGKLVGCPDAAARRSTSRPIPCTPTASLPAAEVVELRRRGGRGAVRAHRPRHGRRRARRRPRRPVELGLTLSPAAELSAVHGGHEDLHVLGYELDVADADLIAILEDFRADRGAPDRGDGRPAARAGLRARRLAAARAPRGRQADRAPAPRRRRARPPRQRRSGCATRASTGKNELFPPYLVPGREGLRRAQPADRGRRRSRSSTPPAASPCGRIRSGTSTRPDEALGTLDEFAARGARRRRVLLRHPHRGADAAAARGRRALGLLTHRIDRLPRPRSRPIFRVSRVRGSRSDRESGPDRGTSERMKRRELIVSGPAGDPRVSEQVEALRADPDGARGAGARGPRARGARRSRSS